MAYYQVIYFEDQPIDWYLKKLTRTVIRVQKLPVENKELKELGLVKYKIFVL